MSAKLRAQFESQCESARIGSAFSNTPHFVVLRRYRGEPGFVSIFGGSISWGAVSLWCEKQAMRFRVLRVYRDGREVPKAAYEAEVRARLAQWDFASRAGGPEVKR